MHYLSERYIKILSIFFCWILGVQQLVAHNLVFIHIGAELPPYIHDVLFQARLFNPQDTMYLLASGQVASFIDPALNVCHIPLEELTQTETHRVFKQLCPEERFVNNTFWCANERFLYLDDFIQQYNVMPLVHMENDTLLYASLDELMAILGQNYPGMAAVFDNDDRCIPCFVYVGSKDSMHLLAQLFVGLGAQGKNDMQILAIFKQLYGEQLIDNLPIIMPEYVQRYELKSPCGYATMLAPSYSKNIEKFNAIFDAAALGQYLGGIDPRNGPSAPGFINESCLFNAGLLHYVWVYDAQLRKIPYAQFNGIFYRINTLHIHSKILSNFLSVPRLAQQK